MTNCHDCTFTNKGENIHTFKMLPEWPFLDIKKVELDGQCLYSALGLALNLDGNEVYRRASLWLQFEFMKDLPS